MVALCEYSGAVVRVEDPHDYKPEIDSMDHSLSKIMAKPVPETLLKMTLYCVRTHTSNTQQFCEFWEPPKPQIVGEELRYHFFDQEKGFSVKLSRKQHGMNTIA